MTNFLLCGHDLKFLTPVINFVKSLRSTVVTVLQTHGHRMSTEEIEEAEKAIVVADIIFCEWALGDAVWFSNNKRPGQLLVIRMHAQEYQAKLPFLSEMNWANVDAFVVICQEAVDYMAQKYPFVMDKVHLIYNPIDIVNRFSRPKVAASDFSLGFLGMVPFRKRPDLALDIFEKCAEKNKNFKLRIKGKKPSDYPWMSSRKDELSRYEERFDKPLNKSPYKSSVVFDGFDPDPGAWYAKCGFILSTSDFEGSHQAVAEGMAQGCIPVIRDWISADRLYPKEFVWHDVDAAVRMVLKARRSPTAYFAQVQKCRQFAMRNFEARDICLKFDAIFSKHPSWQSVRTEYPMTEVCVAQLAWIPVGCHNGYRVHVEKYSAQYKRLGMRTVLICLHDGKASESELAQHRKDLERLGCHVYTVPVSDFFAMKMNDASKADIVRKVKTILDLEYVDVLETHALYCGRVGKLVKEARKDTLFACVFHGVNPEEAEMSGASPARVKMLEELEFEIINAVDFAHYVSNSMEAHYIAKFGLLRPSCIVPCCLRKEALRDNIKKRNVLKLPRKRPVLGYVGTLVAWQCKEEMFKLFGEVFRRHKDVYFAILTQEPYHEEVHRLMAENGVKKSDYLVQEVSFDEVSAAVSQFNAGVMLRKWSPVNRVASPTKFGEMIAAGVPIVSTDGIGDYSEDVRKNDFGVIVPLPELDARDFSTDTCESVYRLLLEKRNESDEYIERSVRFCRENLVLEEHVECIADWYWKLLNIKVDDSKSPLHKGDEGFPTRMARKVSGMPTSNGCRYFDRIKTRIGIICDEFYWDSICNAADFVYISCSDWEEKIKSVDCLYLVSTWHGLKNDDWLDLSREGTPKRKLVYEMIDRCRARGVPIVFYSKEDPPNYNRFVGIAQRCDFVFTSCEEIIPRYRKDCRHDRVWSMRFGINPVCHNPVGSHYGEKMKDVIFSGSWMGDFPERCQDMKMVFSGVIRSGRGLNVVNRNYWNRGNPVYCYPREFQKSQTPEIDHDSLQKIHRFYDWAININSVKDSRTMFANRVYELQACGNLLISNYSLGVSETFPGVFIARTEDDVVNALSLPADEVANRQAAGVRRVMTGETCFDRIAYMLKTIGIPAKVSDRKILVICKDVKKAQKIFDLQTYKNKVLCAQCDLTPELYASADIIAFFDHREKYDEFYLEDMSNAFKYTDCDYIVKSKGSLSGGYDFVSHVDSKWRTLFWRESFEIEQLLKLDAFDRENGCQIP